MNKENYFISLFKTKHIGDDAAFIEGFTYSKDAFFEDVHFKTAWMNYEQIARKAMLVNLSDAIAMNAKPMYALLSVAMPKGMSKTNMQALAKGFLDVAKEYGVQIIGGDTISNIKLDITITIIAQTKKPLLRRGLRATSLLAYTGDLGKSQKDLQTLLNGGRLHKKSKFMNIELREKFVSQTARLLQAGMDISDGLLSDLDKMATTNRVGFAFRHTMPKKQGCSGEEYEMLVGFDKRNEKALLRRAQQSRTKITIFAQVARNKYKNRCQAHHF